MKRDELDAILLLAGITGYHVHKLINGYWPNHPDYDRVRDDSPWRAVTVEGEGVITIGWRKRVIAIDWQETQRRGIVTVDDVTKADDHVHAYSLAKAVEYLKAWRSLPLVPAGVAGTKAYVIEGRDAVVGQLEILTEPSDETNMVIQLVKSVPDNVLVVASCSRVTGPNKEAWFGFNIRIGSMHVSHYPRGKRYSPAMIGR